MDLCWSLSNVFQRKHLHAPSACRCLLIPLSGQSTFPRSKIPQFIVDARQPWIIKNKTRLENLQDVKSYLCSAIGNSPMVQDSERPDLEVPPDLFDYLEIDNNRIGMHRPGWPNAMERLREMKECPAALAHVKHFNVDVFVHKSEHSEFYLRNLEWSRPSNESMDAFADVLGNMISLERLEWGVPPSSAHYFEHHFTKRGLSMPSVKKLLPGGMSHFLVDPAILLTHAGAHASNLTSFSIDYGFLQWTPAILKGNWPSHYSGNLVSLTHGRGRRCDARSA
ncbi:hypothetical protein GGR57DRAFT_462823 [Xylariaceae sp. FL1272]|nr:hypothetical protein GGR57DRAFT_462823 [Xylariaceae sp. FL1272]